MTLEQRIQNVLAEASLIAEASAAGLNDRTSHGKAGSKEPTMAGTSTYDKVRRRLSAAETPQERLRAVQWAEAQVRRAKRQRPREESTMEKDFWKKRQVLDKEGVHYEDVAFNLKLDAKYVWKVRSGNDLEPRYGLPKRRKAA